MVRQIISTAALCVCVCVCGSAAQALYPTNEPLTYERISAKHALWLEQHGASLYQPGFRGLGSMADGAAARARLGQDAGGGSMLVGLSQVIQPGTSRIGNDVQEFTEKVPPGFVMDPNYKYHVDVLFNKFTP